MTNDSKIRGETLQTILACLEAETTGRAEGAKAGAVLFEDAELAALVDLLRREVGTAGAQGEAGR